ncbi:MAG: permease-like cell division protein FtsX [Thermodesulfobacteriota bacterium]
MPRFLYFFSKAIRNIRRNIFISIVTIVIIGLSLTILGASLTIFLNLNSIAEQWRERIQLTAYLDDDVLGKELIRIKELVGGMEEVLEVTYTSKEDAYTIFQQDLKGLEGILEGLTINPLPASLEIRLKRGFRDTVGVKGLAARLREVNGIDDVQYGGEWLEKFSDFILFLKLFGIGLGVFLFPSTLFIISNTIRLTVLARREEIEIMRLVGATDSFIKAPFIVEGLLQGVIGALLAVFSLTLLHRFFLRGVSSSLTLFFGSISAFTLPDNLFLTLVAFGGGLGVLGSMVSVGRHLKV